MRKIQRNRLYTIACVKKFAKRKAFPQKAFFYLDKYFGIQFLEGYYEYDSYAV